MASKPKPDINFNPPTYMCKRATEKHVLDGRIDKPFWENADFTDLFTDIEGDKREKPRYHTQAKMLWDDENMYFGAILHGDEIWGGITERDAVIFHDNDFEIFIDPNSDTHEYYEFEMNALNTVWDLLLTMPYRDGGKPVNAFDFTGMQSAVYIDGELNNPSAENKYWSVEVVIPLVTLRQCADNYYENPKIGEFCRVNFSRVQWTVDVEDNKFVKRKNEQGNVLPEDNWVWSPTGIVNIHYPELWGYVFFVDKDEKFEIPDDEYIKWELRKLYYDMYEYRDEHGVFSSEIKVNTDRITPCIEVTKNSFEITTPSKDGKREVSILANGRTYVRERG